MLANLNSNAFINKVRRIPWLIVAPVIVVFALLVSVASWQYVLNQQLQAQTLLLKQQQETNVEEASYIRMQQVADQEERQQLEQALIEATSSATLEQQQTIKSLLEQYTEVRAKVDRNAQAKLDVSEIESKIPEWGVQLLKQELKQLGENFNSAQKTLDDQWTAYQASLVKVVAKTPTQTGSQSSSSNPAGYSSTTVSTSRGNFAVKYIKLPLSQVKVKTVSASSNNCSNNCPAKTLASYVQEHGGFAGINGTYFCPPDYGSCSGKTYSYDFAFYNTPTGSWINQSAMSWNSTGLATFNGSNATFYRKASDYPGGPVTAGIANFPTLLVHNGAVVISESEIDSAQKNKGVRGALGVGGGNIYLAIISGASVSDAAYAIHALGATDALNLDGGGSAALYIDGSYKAGPGRLLPNAIVLTR